MELIITNCFLLKSCFTSSFWAPLGNLFELFELIYMNQSEMIDFFVIKKILSMVNIIKEEIEIE